MIKTKKILALGVNVGLLLVGAVATLAHADSIERNSGEKFSPLRQINASNVTGLKRVWEFHTGDIPSGPGLTSFQDTPVLVDNNLIVCSVTRKVFAIDPETGKERWSYSGGSTVGGANKCRGVSVWRDREAEAGALCQTRLIFGTADYRLIALDAKTGKTCTGFGEQGVVTMEADKPQLWPGEVSALSRPAVVNDVVVVGSTVADNQRVDAPSGRVMAFDARSGAFRWSFDPVVRDPADPAASTWQKGSLGKHGGGNVWSGFVVDEKRDLVYLPTTSPSLDFYGVDRPGDNRYTDSVVALKGATGELVWHQQLVHHDVWDYDLPTPGILMDYPHNGEMVPALVQNTKQGMIFIFNRETGEPLVPIEERPVPQDGGLPGEALSPTQPFPVGMPLVAKHGFTLDDVWGFTPIDRWLCRRKAETLQYGDIYTPPSEKGTIYLPSPSGGPDWGGGAVDPTQNIMVVPSNMVAMIFTKIPRANVETGAGNDMKMESRGAMTFNDLGSPFLTQIEPFLSPLGAPCTAPPWAKLYAVDLVQKKILWEVPLGSIEKLAPLPIPWELGTPGVGAPLVTAGGLAFIGYSLDHQFRAFDLKTGAVLWQDELPAPANSTPISYEYKGHQYIVVPAGGHSMYGTALSDTVAAYRLD